MLIDGRIWLNKEEIANFNNVSTVQVSTPKMSIDSRVDTMDNVDNVDVINQENVDFVSTRVKKINKPSGTYKKLFEELKQELREKQERLEIANYRVGQLESQVRNSIPMLEYHNESFKRTQKEDELKKELVHSTETAKKIAKQLHYEKLNKRIFVIILLIILALQPLWLLLVYR
ncbi:hypothetical protein COU74_05265 [Candidatus Peregrinibacteria bacterium CG10_big_fil_rev_8_21_14_0_10_36_19]|nr:MAG: hypothetical protein COU74_05265 [Candidatus Peregrinibacteria bacterium CG10_big_fil_rev_8_21_14_0_10_36_19]